MLVVCGLDPSSTVLADRYEAIVAAAADAPPPRAVLDRVDAVEATDERLGALCARLRARRPPAG
jgi:hypothetical protein